MLRGFAYRLHTSTPLNIVGGYAMAAATSTPPMSASAACFGDKFIPDIPSTRRASSHKSIPCLSDTMAVAEPQHCSVIAWKHPTRSGPACLFTSSIQLEFDEG
jgi:hypothetical protein